MCSCTCVGIPPAEIAAASVTAGPVVAGKASNSPVRRKTVFRQIRSGFLKPDADIGEAICSRLKYFK